MRAMLADTPKLMLASGYWLFFIYLMLPLSLMIAMSFKDSNLIAFPIGDWTLDWYAKAIRDRQFLSACFYSVFIAAMSTISAMVIGLWVAVLIDSSDRRLQPFLYALACLPAVVPGMISAISLRIFANSIGLPPGTGAIIYGHTVHAVPFVVVMVLTRLRTMPSSLVEAARDLGADSLVAFMRVTVPYLAPAIFGGMIFGILLSIDDFVRTYFLGGYRPTLPMLIFAKVQGGMSPEINAMTTLVLIVTVAVGIYAEYMTRRSRKV